MPGVPIRDTEGFLADPYRALVDSHPARHVLHWAPLHTWSDWIRKERG